MDNPSNNNESQKPVPGAFESDSQKVVRRHLEDKDHVITDEEIRNVRIGVSPPANGLQAPTEDRNEESDPADKPVTPWDTIEP